MHLAFHAGRHLEPQRPPKRLLVTQHLLPPSTILSPYLNTLLPTASCCQIRFIFRLRPSSFVAVAVCRLPLEAKVAWSHTAKSARQHNVVRLTVEGTRRREAWIGATHGTHVAAYICVRPCLYMACETMPAW